MADESVRYEEEFFLNSRGMKLFTCRWLPRGEDVRALIFLCHGYGMECSEYMKDVGVRLSEAGYGVFGIDIEGHGKSEGLRCYIKNFSLVIDDYIAYSNCITEQKDYRSKPRFLYGESMGGAVALLIHRKEPQYWQGAMLVAPMCKISDKLKPPQLVTSILSRLAHVIPTWRIVPTKDIIDISFKDPQKREKIRSNPLIYQGKPRLKTALELLNASLDMERRLDEVTMPFLLLHGEDDIVTDPEISKQLYEISRSVDKTFKLYPSMWHGLTFGEPPKNAGLVFNDIISWLDDRSSINQNGPTSSLAILKQGDLFNILEHEGNPTSLLSKTTHLPPPLGVHA